jgi:phospholipid/cholesterol/gamma-HCH transport system substrate-binding protein
VILDRMNPQKDTTGHRSAIPSSAWKMAVFATVTVVLIGLLATLIGNISFTSSRTFYGRFTDATGVLHGDRVRVSGVEVGKIRDVRLVSGDDGRQQALVEFEVRDDVPMSKDARLELRFENIVGQRYLAIEQKPGGSPMRAGATYGTAQTTPALNLTQLFNGFQPLLRALDADQTNQLSFQLVKAFQGEAGSISQLLKHTASLTNTLADKDVVIGNVVRNLNDVLTTVDTRDQELTALIVEFRNLMVGLSSQRETVSIELPRLARLLGATSGMLRDVRPGLKSTIANLGKVAKQLDIDRTVLEASLKEVPKKLQLMARTGSYGSWFNFYVCGMEVRLKVLGGVLYLGTPAAAANEADSVCSEADVTPEDFEGTAR